VLFNRRRDDIPQDNPDRWLLTYADLITLLLAFFIVMYSMSRIDAKKFGKVSQALQGILKGGTAAIRLPELNTLNTGHGLLRVGDLKMLQTKVQEQVNKIGHEKDVMAEVNERGLVIHIMESAMFDEAHAELKPRAKELLDLVTNDIINLPNHVRVEGHTDDRPINTDKFPSNWELSAARATTVVRYLVDNHGFPPEKISALGFASYRPFMPNTSVENRARNRRVDVVVMTMELSQKEPQSQINDFATDQMKIFIGRLPRETDSLPDRNYFPY
jgi:chemotaxis protein MotB